MVKPTVMCLRYTMPARPAFAGLPTQPRDPLMRVQLAATEAQGGSASLTVGMVAGLLSLTGLTMDHMEQSVRIQTFFLSWISHVLSHKLRLHFSCQ